VASSLTLEDLEQNSELEEQLTAEQKEVMQSEENYSPYTSA
jgi:hypothetical protein